MNFDRTGIILYTLEYEKCIQFYRDVLKLPILFTTPDLTCFGFGQSYLMVELDDEYFKTGSDKGRVRTCLRMNVPNVKSLADHLQQQGIEVDYQERSWGTVAKFFDPDGNLCAFRDSASFEKQITTSS